MVKYVARYSWGEKIFSSLLPAINHYCCCRFSICVNDAKRELWGKKKKRTLNGSMSLLTERGMRWAGDQNLKNLVKHGMQF